MTSEDIEAFAERLRSISREIDAVGSVEDRLRLAHLMSEALVDAVPRVAVSRQDAYRALKRERGWTHAQMGEHLGVDEASAGRIANAKLKRP